MIENSIGNVTEILDLLDADKYTKTELLANYELLKEQWGEWMLFGDEGTGISIKYIDIGNALFSGLMVTYTIFTTIFLVASIVIGKITLPLLAKMYKDNNEQLVDLATLKTMENVNELSGKKGDNKKPKKEWF